MTLDVRKIRLLMVDRELSCAALARAAKVSTQTMNKWMNHGTKPRLDKVGGLAKALGVSVEQIIIMD